MTENINPFKRLRQEKEVPADLREKLMRDIGYIRIFSDIAELFSLKYFETVQALFKTEAGREAGRIGGSEDFSI